MAFTEVSGVVAFRLEARKTIKHYSKTLACQRQNIIIKLLSTS